MNEIRWRFPDNNYGETKGINDAGIETFGANTLNSVVRESIQNSLDACLEKTEPVVVEFSFFKMNRDDFPGEKYFGSVLDACDDFSNGNDKVATEFFNKAIDIFNSEFDVLKISDHNTTGLIGADSDETGTAWSGLVKESGSSDKGNTSGGSFGIGKFASFAFSRFRTVFFNSVDVNEYQSNIGVARLITFEEVRESKTIRTTGVGYYSDSFKNTAINSQYHLKNEKPRSLSDSGTDIYIMGARVDEDTIKEIEYSVVNNFMVSIYKNKLKVIIDGVEINQRNLSSYVFALDESGNKEASDIKEYFDCLVKCDEDHLRIVFDPQDELGLELGSFGYEKNDCTLIIKRGDDLNRKIMQTRDAGMKLFEQGNISGSIQFTGILMIEGDKMNKDFRAMEVPSHDAWEPSRVEDKKTAEKKYAALRKWMREVVKKYFSVARTDEVDAVGAGLYLPAEVETNITKTTPGMKDVNKPARKKKKKPRITKTTPKPVNSARSFASVEPGSGGDGHTTGKKPGKGGGSRGGSGKGDRDGFKLTYIPQRTMCLSPTEGKHLIQVVVPSNNKRSKLCIDATTESSGSLSLQVKEAHVVSGEANITDIKDNQIFFESKKGEKVQIEFITSFNRYCAMEARYYEAKK